MSSVRVRERSNLTSLVRPKRLEEIYRIAENFVLVDRPLRLSPSDDRQYEIFRVHRTQVLARRIARSHRDRFDL